MEENNVPELDFFNLDSKDDCARVIAARGVVKLLREKTETGSDSHNLYLILKWIIRALGRDEAVRHGCFTSLVGYLSLFPPHFNIAVFVEIIESELQPVESNTENEKEEIYLGQILAYGSIIISRLIFSSPLNVQKNILDKLFQLGQLSSRLHHASFMYITALLVKARKKIIPDGFLDDMTNLNENPLDKLNYLLAMNGKKSVDTSTIRAALGTENFWDLTNVSIIFDSFINSKSEVMLGHSFIDEFVGSICRHPDFFILFWSTLINQKHLKNDTTDLIMPSSCDDSVTLELCRRLLNVCSRRGSLDLRKSLWNENFLFLLLKNLKNNKKAVQDILNEFCACITPAGDEANLSVIQLTLFDLGVLNFDALTGSKTILITTGKLSFNALRALSFAYKAIIENRNRIISFDGQDSSFLTCLNYFIKLINSRECIDRTTWRMGQLIYLLKLGYFKQLHVHLKRELIIHVQEAFLVSLGHRFLNLDSFQKALNGLFLKLNDLFDKSRDNLLIPFTDEMYEAWKKSFSLNDLITKFIDLECRSKNEKELVSILKILLQYMSLLILKEPSTAVINILYLNSIFFEAKKRNKAIWIEVTTDIFLNLLSQQNYHHKRIFRCIFKSLRSHLTLESFNQIVEVLKLSYDPQNLLELNNKPEESESHDDDHHSEQEGNHSSKYNQLANFRIRIIQLIEIYIEIPWPLSHWLSIAIPLIELYGSTFGQKQLDKLKNRINCCIRKIYSTTLTVDKDCIKEIVTVLDDLFKKVSASTGVYSNMKTVLSSMIKFILCLYKPSFSTGLGVKQLANNEIFQIFKKNFEDFFHDKNNIPVDLFNFMISIGWDGILALIPILMHFIFDDNLKIHKRVLGIKMLEIFIKTRDFFDGHLERYFQLYLTTNAEIFNDLFTDELENICIDKNLNETFYTELWSCLFVVLQTQADDSEFPQMISSKKVKDLLSTKYQYLLPIMKGQQCKKNFEELCHLLQINLTNTSETKLPKSDVKECSGTNNINKRKGEENFQEGLKKKIKKEVVSCN